FSLVHCPRQPTSPPFPYTTLFRSVDARRGAQVRAGARVAVHDAASVDRVDEVALVRALEQHLLLAPGRAAVVGGERHLEAVRRRSEEHTSELQSPYDLVCRLLLEK